MHELGQFEILKLTAQVVSAHVSHNRMATSDLPDLIARVHTALSELDGTPATMPDAAPEPAVPIKRSIHADYIICLEDGAKLKMLKRYLMAQHGLSPDQYRAKWQLPADYPMIAPAYAERRRELARSSGLGRKAG